MRRKYLHTVLLSILFAVHTAEAQQRLGMEITGDDDGAFGLLISNWMEDANAPFLAPGLIDQQLTPLDRKLVEDSLNVENALRQLPPAGAR